LRDETLDHLAYFHLGPPSPKQFRSGTPALPAISANVGKRKTPEIDDFDVVPGSSMRLRRLFQSPKVNRASTPLQMRLLAK
jgi:hypothetical protein